MIIVNFCFHSTSSSATRESSSNSHAHDPQLIGDDFNSHEIFSFSSELFSVENIAKSHLVRSSIFRVLSRVREFYKKVQRHKKIFFSPIFFLNNIEIYRLAHLRAIILVEATRGDFSYQHNSPFHSFG